MTLPLHVLLNPAGAGGRAGRRWAELEPRVRERFPSLAVHRSREPGELIHHARELARREPSVLIAAGGDGTSHEVLNGILDGDAPGAVLGWLPLGTGNDLAFAAGTPRDPRAAIARWNPARTRRIDAGRVRWAGADGHRAEHWFGNSLTAGLAASVVARLARRRTGSPGPARYLLAGVRAILREPAAPLAVTADGDDWLRGPALLASVTNGPTFGAGMRIAPGARLDDGRLDLVTVGALPWWRALRLLPRVYRGTHVGRSGIRHRAVARVTIDAPAPLALEIDGELLTDVLPPVEVEVRPAHLTILDLDG